MLKKIFALSILFCMLASVSMAATYGYITVKGKKESALIREVNMISMHIAAWKNGKVLYQTKEKSGALFFKKYTHTLVFSGSKSEISKFLTQSPYEGDFLRDMVVKMVYTSYDSKGAALPNHTVLMKKFPNAAKAAEFASDATAKDLWSYLGKRNAKAYKDHTEAECLEPKVELVFYSLKATEDNRVFNVAVPDNGYTPQGK